MQNGPYHVLLIVDDPKETELCSDLVREVGNCKIDVNTRAASSFDWISRSNYHLVILDVVSGVDGLTVLEQIRRISPVTSVIVICEQATVEQAVAAIRLGAEDYLKKPFNPESFQLAVKRGLDKKAVLGEHSTVSGFFHLLNSCQMISASLEQTKIFGIVESYFARELKCDHSAIYSLVDGRAARAGDSNAGDLRQDRAMEEIMDIAIQASNPLERMIESGESYRFVERGTLTPGLFVFRFRCAGTTEYFCVCLSPVRPGNVESFESRMRMLKSQIEVTGRNIEQYMGVQSLAYMDDATGLYNTRYLNYILDREIQQAIAADKPFAVLFIDADRFKSVNDTHGHLIGTKLLNELGEQLKKLVREKDTVFRYGGDEFVAVLSPCDLLTAKAVAERIRAHVEARAFLADEGLALHFTISIGVALFPEHASSKKDIINAADHAMYAAKKTTRNSVTIAEKPVVAVAGAATLGEARGNLVKLGRPPSAEARKKK